MSVNNYFDNVEDAARYALAKAKAIDVCTAHPGVTIRVGDPDAEKHAYALATTMMKASGTYWMRDDILPEIKDQLDMAADDECPECAYQASR